MYESVTKVKILFMLFYILCKILMTNYKRLDLFSIHVHLLLVVVNFIEVGIF